ncbi:MAG: hypothetical protein JNL11_14805 [Bdellovibrionaceae bacterium]|nr:hypothetical protein [Pseudobdellovibrionaceae bacterium]
MSLKSLFAIWLTTLYSLVVQSEPLGIIPAIEEGYSRIKFEFQSDIWTRPDQNKESPVRFYGGTIHLPLIQTNEWSASLKSSDESLSLARTDMHVGNNVVEIGSNLQSRSIGLGLEKRTEKSTFTFFAFHDSASEEPYRNDRDVFNRYAFAYHLPSLFNEDSVRWFLGLESSNNRGYLNGQTLPIVGASFKPHSNTTVIIGIPFLRVIWHEPGFWTSQIHMGVVGVSYEGEFIHSGEVSSFIQSGISTRSYAHTQRLNDEKRLFYQENYYEGGLKLRVKKTTVFRFVGGFSNGRKLYEGQQSFRSQGAVQSINSDLYSKISMEFQIL